MFNNKKPQLPKDLRLHQSKVVPSFEDIQFVLDEANKIKGRWVELPFLANKNEYLISVKVISADIEPKYVLSQMFDNDKKIIWDYETRDLSLICNLVSSSCGDGILNESPILNSPFGKSNKHSNTLEMSRGGSDNLQDSMSNSLSMSSVAFSPPKPGLKASLEGDIKNLQIPNLLQSISLAKMTGLLDIKNKIDEAKIYFLDGLAYHCVTKDGTGDIALTELLVWEEGEFRFWPDEKINEKSINKRLDLILMEGVALLDQNRYLDSQGLKLESCLVKKNPVISEQEFIARLSKGAPISIEAQLNFYESIDNRSTLFNILRQNPMPKLSWIPIVFNLVSCGLVQITSGPQNQNRVKYLKSIGIDEDAMFAVLKSLIRNETNIFTYPAFIYFLDQEYLRYEHLNTAFSLVLFSLVMRTENGIEPLPQLAVKRAMQRISLIKRNIDVLGHYETFDFGIILPSTNAAAAAALANRICDVLREVPLVSNLDPRFLGMAFGVASVPDDCIEMDKLIEFAKLSRDRAKQTGQRVVVARDLNK